MSQQVTIDIALGVEHQTFLRQLQLVWREHNDDRQHQRDKGAVKGNAQAYGHAGNIALNGLVGLTQCITNTTYVPIKPMDGMAQEI